MKGDTVLKHKRCDNEHSFYTGEKQQVANHPAPVWRRQYKVCYEYLTLWEILLTLTMLPKFLLDTIKELIRNWQHLKYEIYVPDWEKERSEGLAESYHHIRHNGVKNEALERALKEQIKRNHR